MEDPLLLKINNQAKIFKQTYLEWEGNVGNTTCTKAMMTLPNWKTLQGKDRSR